MVVPWTAFDAESTSAAEHPLCRTLQPEDYTTSTQKAAENQRDSVHVKSEIRTTGISKPLGLETFPIIDGSLLQLSDLCRLLWVSWFEFARYMYVKIWNRIS